MSTQRTPDMVYCMHKSKFSGGPSGNKRLIITPQDSKSHKFHPRLWDKVCNIRVYYKPEFVMKIAKEKCFDYVDFYYASNEPARP